MIQRIQTLWFLISAAAAGLLMAGNISDLTAKNGVNYSVGFSGLYRGGHLLTPLYPISVILVLLLLLSVAGILLYKNRKIQKLFTYGIIIFSLSLILMIIYSSYRVINDFAADLVFGPKLILLAVMPLSAYLAYRGIKKDDELIKSYDRLR